jgi:hypothetical protein
VAFQAGGFGLAEGRVGGGLRLGRGALVEQLSKAGEQASADLPGGGRLGGRGLVLEQPTLRLGLC